MTPCRQVLLSDCVGPEAPSAQPGLGRDSRLDESTQVDTALPLARSLITNSGEYLRLRL